MNISIVELPPLAYIEFMENMTRPAKPSDLMERAAAIHKAIARAKARPEPSQPDTGGV